MLSSDDDDDAQFETCKCSPAVFTWMMWMNIALIALIHLDLQVLQRVKTPNVKPKKTSDSEDRRVTALHDDHSRNHFRVLMLMF